MGNLSSEYLLLLSAAAWLVLATAGMVAFRRQRRLAQREIRERTLALRAAKEAAEAAARAKSDFLAVMSHEIRTPLGGVIGMLDLLRRLPQLPQQRHYTKLAHESAEVLLELLDDVLDMAKIEAGRLTLESITFDVRSEFARFLEGMRLRAASKGVDLTWEIPATTPERLKGDPTRLRQVLANLVSNALKFTSEGSVKVMVRTEKLDQRVRLCVDVLDTGPGMTPETIGRIFSKFEQGDASTTRRYGGTGLGLAIAKHLVELMHGSIHVTSNVGAGSTFSFCVRLDLPSEAELQTPLSSNTRAPLPRHDESLRILCAEDDMINRVIAEGFVVAMGHSIEFANDGIEAIEKLSRQEFDAVLMDARMPRMDGIEATRVIRGADSPVLDRDIFIIAATANASGVFGERCLEAGMNRFITKPFRESDLHAALAAAIEHQRSRGRSPRKIASAARPKQSAPEAPGLSEAELLAMLSDPPTATKERTVPVDIRQQYLKDAPMRLAQMRSAIRSRDHRALAIAAHSIKNISHYVAAERLSTLGGMIETAADAGRWNEIMELIPEAEEEFAAVRTRLESSAQTRSTYETAAS